MSFWEVANHTKLSCNFVNLPKLTNIHLLITSLRRDVSCLLGMSSHFAVCYLAISSKIKESGILDFKVLIHSVFLGLNFISHMKRQNYLIKSPCHYASSFHGDGFENLFPFYRKLKNWLFRFVPCL